MRRHELELYRRVIDLYEKLNFFSELDSTDKRTHLTLYVIDLSEAENSKIHLVFAAKRSQTIIGQSEKEKVNQKKKINNFMPWPEGELSDILPQNSLNLNERSEEA